MILLHNKSKIVNSIEIKKVLIKTWKVKELK